VDYPTVRRGEAFGFPWCSRFREDVGAWGSSETAGDGGSGVRNSENPTTSPLSYDFAFHAEQVWAWLTFRSDVSVV
jgi:hypothetical protein